MSILTKKFLQRLPALCWLAYLLHSFPVAAQVSVDDYYEDARQYFSRGEFEDAEIQLKNALQLEDQHLPSLILLGDLYFTLEQSSAAEAAYAEALVLGADASYVAPRLIQCYLAQRKFQRMLDEVGTERLRPGARSEVLGGQALALIFTYQEDLAEARLRDALAINPQSRLGNIAAAQLYLNRGQATEANRVTESLIDIYPNDARVWNLHASTLLALGRREDALQAFSEALSFNPLLAQSRVGRASLLIWQGDYEAAEADIDFVLEQMPMAPRASYLKAQLLESAGEDELAQEYYLKTTIDLLRADTTYIAKNPQLTLLGAFAHTKLGDREQARKYLESYFAENQDDVVVGKTYASFLLEDGNAAEAQRIMADLRQSNPEDPELIFLSASALAQLGRYESVVELLNSLTGATLEDIEVQSLLARSRIEIGEDVAGVASLEAVVAVAPERIADRRFLLKTYLEQGNTRAAVSLGEALLEIAPDDARIQNLLARSYFSLGDYERASLILKQAMSENPDFPSLQSTLAEVEVAQGNYEQALQLLIQLSESYPENYIFALQRAQVEALAGDKQAARKWAENAVILGSATYEPRAYLVELLMELGDLIAAENLARETAARNQDLVDARFLLARVLVEAGRTRDARNVYLLISRRHEGDADVYYRNAQAQLRIGEYSDASQSLYKALVLEPESLRYRAAFIEIELKLEKYASALELANDLINDFPGNATPIALKAAVLQGMGDLVEAAEHFELARGLEPENRAYLLRQHEALVAAADLEGAERVVKTWLVRHPNDEFINFAYSALLIKMGRWQEAETLLAEMLDRNPENPVVLNSLAYVSFQLGRSDALDIARRALAAAPSSPDVNDTLGWILVQEGKAEEGIPYLRQALVRKADDPLLRYHLAVALNKLGRNSEALMELDKLLVDQQEFAERDQALALRESLL
jgi:putative PEP-CTERM system TPR-repeat lipoprotein